MSKLYQDIKELIISSLELEDIKASEIGDEETLFGDGLGLDSIDALELGVALQKKFGIKIESKKEELTDHFANVKSLSRYIESLQARESGV